MTSQFLPVYLSNAEITLLEMLPSIVSGDVNLQTILTFCSYYRRRGICYLFLDGTSDSLHLDLRRSGQAFLHFLNNADDAMKATSKAAPFFDAIACKDFDCAGEIALNSRLSWNAEEEYEDDFLYIFFLMQSFFLQDSELESVAILQKYEEVVGQTRDVHLEICKSFLYNSDELFEEALMEFLVEREEKYERLANAGAIPDEVLATERYFSVEGLALVRLAEARGYKTQKNYLFIPSVAREEISVVFKTDDWKSVLE